MEKRDNYAITAKQARASFLNYDCEALARKLGCRLTEEYLYTTLFHEEYRIHRQTANISRKHHGQWVDANSFHEALTLLDLVCDSKENRSTTGVMKSMASFGLQFHQTLTETADPWAAELEQKAPLLERAFLALGGKRYHLGDCAWQIEVFDGLTMVFQLWFSDDEFPAQIRYLWDENANQYIRYETMYYALGLLKSRIREEIAENKQ